MSLVVAETYHVGTHFHGDTWWRSSHSLSIQIMTIMTPTGNVILYVIQCITAIGGNSTGKGRRDDRLLIDFPYLSGC